MYMFLLIELTSGQECQCYPVGTKSSDVFSPAGCENTETHSYCFENNFYYDTNSIFNETIIKKTLTINSTVGFKISNYFRLVDNVVLTQNGAFHIVNGTIIGANSQLLVNTFYSLAGYIQLENPQLNRPQIILWNSSYLHLNRNITNRVDFKSKTPLATQSALTLDNICILSTMFPYKFDDGIGYLISNQRLIRFCPKGTNLSNTVTCTLVNRLYTDSNYSPNYSPQTFDYPHCPCNSDKTLNCELKLMTNSVLTYSFGDIKFDAEQIPFTTPCSVKFDTSTNTFSCNNDMIFSVNFTKKVENFVINSSSKIASLNLFSNSSVFILGKTKLNNIMPMYFGEFDRSYVIMIDGTLNSNNCILLEITKEKTTCKLCNSDYRLYDGTCIIKESNCVNYNKNSICVSCSSGYVLDDNYNCILSEKCEYGTTSNCYKYNNCILNHNCIYGDGTVCIKCETGESHSKCENCANTNCLKCNSDVCRLCQTGYVLNDTKNCVKESLGFSYGISTVYCNNKFYMENFKCRNCLTKHENSILCNTNISLRCDDNFIITEDGNCITKNCKVNEINEENGQCTLPQEKCLSIVNNKCIECDSNYILTNTFTCEIMNATNSIENCKQNNQMGCIECDFGYYLSHGLCFSCSENCTSCIETSTKCLSCEIDYYQGDNYKCLPNGELTEKCDKISTVTTRRIIFLPRFCFKKQRAGVNFFPKTYF
ncbi:hypothetical protein EIN_235350 [Entamoeba invadens IP1]|uniref:Protein serine/threonine kinase n=1 Tax=Entamoeba invadens IP1 TaxID=370355 RepID=L7FMA5_ENTIV|nr:hypothetical protein EIN_235350 [Entamoeba invadens IP1]ELP86018.1 hypothetical protein EIN_235350 [Entamoeba invadens IP1]|eukprot:XP_004185364.1 hypothetical protein EIN_235350 [Entamoeba invadens IP1]